MQSYPSSIDLTKIAKQAMKEYDLFYDFPPEVLQEINHIHLVPPTPSSLVKNLQHFLWFSLDNEHSKDLDQLTYAETLDSQEFKIYIAIADVASLVKKESFIDHYAQHNTTSVYTPTKNFPMLPEKLSTDLTSLNENQNRLAIIVEVIVQINGSLGQYAIYPAYVQNHAKLAFNSVSDWLDGISSPPIPIKDNIQLKKQIYLQDKIAQILRGYRADQGALYLQMVEPQPVVNHNQVMDIVPTVKNRGNDLIEDFMIAANSSVAAFLKEQRIPSFRRIVRIPKRWDRIVEIARKYGEGLPLQPDAKALNAFLMQRRLVDPLHFPDLSLTIIKLLGNGEYVVEYPEENPIGHFALAVKDYTHSTAPNRRYPDIIIQRLIKATLEKKSLPYTYQELQMLAQHCTQKEDDANKVERKMKKSAACLVLSSKIHQEFDALVTGTSSKGTWVRVFQPPVEGKLIKGTDNLDVGDQIRVQLVQTDIEKGFIDFIRT